MHAHLARVGFLLLVGLILAGCQRVDPLDQVVIAPSPVRLNMWKSRMEGPPSLRQDFEAALQEIRYGIMMDRTASGSEAVDQALRAMVDGRTLRQVLRRGYSERLLRLESELESYNTSAAYVAEKREQHQDRLRALQEKILLTKEQVQELEPKPGESRIKKGDEPDEMPVRVKPGA